VSLWSNILNDIKGIVSPFVGGVPAGANIGAQQVAGTQAPQTVQALQGQAQQAIAASNIQTTPKAPGSDLLLAAAKPVGQAISLGITRPLSTLGLLADKNIGDIGIADIKKRMTVLQRFRLFRLLHKQVFFKTPYLVNFQTVCLKKAELIFKR
jgi:hypothetical protein